MKYPEKKIRNAREELRRLYNKYMKEFYEINKKIDTYLEVLEKEDDKERN